MKEWPADGKPVNDFEGIVKPLANVLRKACLIRRPAVYPTYKGYPQGFAHVIPPLEKQLTKEGMQYEREHGRDIYDVVIGAAIRIGMEHGRRHDANDPMRQLERRLNTEELLKALKVTGTNIE